MNKHLRAYLSKLGKKGGSVCSDAKKEAAKRREEAKRQLRASVLINQSKGEGECQQE